MQMVRAIAVLEQLRANPDGVSLKTLADRFGVSKNTIQRDIDQLSAAGMPIGERQHGQTLLYRLEERAPISSTLGPEDLKALRAARATMLPFKRSAAFKAYEAALSKVEAELRPQASDAAFEGPLWSGAQEMAPGAMDTLLRGILERRRCRVLYRPRGKTSPKKYLIEPHAFLFWNGVLYLRASVPPYDNLVPFVGHQFQETHLTDEVFERKNMERTGFGVFQSSRVEQVEVEFRPEVAAYIREKRWHPTQQLKELPDGGVLFRAELSGQDEFLGWVMSWGGAAELLSPSHWRNVLLGRAEALVQAHGNKKQKAS